MDIGDSKIMYKLKNKISFLVLILLSIASFVLINLIFSVLEEKKPVKLDLTAAGTFSISDETKQVLNRVNQDIDVYYFVTSGKEIVYVKQTVDMYKGYNNKIHFKQIDPSHEPVLTSNIGTEVTDNSVVVKCGEKVKSIPLETMYDSTYEEYGISEFKLEQKLTLAIDYVLRKEENVILFTKGHEEAGYTLMKADFEDENAIVQEVDLVNEEIPQDTSAVYIISPRRDFSAEEIGKLQKYLESGGSLNISIDYDVTDTVVLRRFLSEYWGINYENDIIFEGDKLRYAANNPYVIIPQYGEHDIVSPIEKAKVNILWPNTRSITILEKDGVEIKPLLLSSKNAAVKPSTNAQDTTVTSKDKIEQVNVAVVAEYINPTLKKPTRIIATGSSFYLLYKDEPSIANSDFIRNCLNYLRNEDVSVSITPKNIYVKYMSISQKQIARYTFFYGILPPILVLAAGFYVWLKRRHK